MNYDIYGLIHQREGRIIEKFLFLFFDRQQVEIRQRNTLIPIPNVFREEKQRGYIRIYVPKHLRSDLLFLSITFTEDNRLILGVTLKGLDRQRCNDLLKAEAIETKLWTSLGLELTSI